VVAAEDAAGWPARHVPGTPLVLHGLPFLRLAAPTPIVEPATVKQVKIKIKIPKKWLLTGLEIVHDGDRLVTEVIDG
jgi:hypothetical protein